MPNLPDTHPFCSRNPPSGATRALHFQGALQQVRAKPLAPTWDRKQKLPATRPSSFNSRAGKAKAPSAELILSGESQARACHTWQHCPVGSATARPPASPGEQTSHAHVARASSPGWSPRPTAATQPPAVIYTAPRTGPARPAAWWDRSPGLLPSPGGVRGPWLRLGDRQIRNHKQLPPSPKSSCSTLSPRAQLHLSLGVFSLSQATRELHVQKFFPTASHGY